MSNLYVFVDESGQHHRGECYTVAACWCISDRSDPGTILKPTKLGLMDALMDVLPHDNRPSELKSSSLQRPRSIILSSLFARKSTKTVPSFQGHYRGIMPVHSGFPSTTSILTSALKR